MLIAVIADDLTGAADTGVQFVHAGYRTAVFFRATEVLADDLDGSEATQTITYVIDGQ